MSERKRVVSRAAAKRKTAKPVQPDIVPEDIEEFDEAELIGIPSGKVPKSIHHTFSNFIDRNHLTQEQVTAYIYKYETENSTAGTLCTQISGEMPSEHDIGAQFGGGRYYVVIQGVDATGKRFNTTKSFRLHKRYDSLQTARSENPLMAMPSFFPQSSGTGGNSGSGGAQMKEMFGMMQMFMSIMQPLINRPQPETPQYIASMMADNYKMMSSAMKEVYADTTQFLNEKMRDQGGLAETTETESEVTGVMGVLGQITPLLEQFLPLILSNKPVTSQATVAMVKALPEFQALKKDRKMIKGLIAHIYKKHGEQAARAACKKFNIRYADPKLKPIDNLTVKKTGGPKNEKV